MKKTINLMLAAGTLALAGCGQQKNNPEVQPGAEPARPAAAANISAAESAPAPVDFAKLKGRWERPDGGYVLEILEIAPDGKASAGYFNPSPIKVEGAQVSSEDGKLKLFLTLRDTNYPGCTYSLTYDPQTDQLFGKYYQAAVQQTYDVAFARLK